MNELKILRDKAFVQLLDMVVQRKLPLELSYQIDGCWHIVRTILTQIHEEKLVVKVSPRKKSSFIDLAAGKNVGVSFRCGIGRHSDNFIFDGTVIDCDCTGEDMVISLTRPDNIEIVQRRSYFRVTVPKHLKVPVVLWQRPVVKNSSEVISPNRKEVVGRLIDISAGGMRVILNSSERNAFQKGQFLGLKFKPIASESPLMFNAQVKIIVPTANEKYISMGLSMVGLEASPEGRLVLQRLCNVVDEYHNLNSSCD